MADPAWKNKLRPASFRGAAFYIASHGFSGGRRGVQHEFAQRDVPNAEDTGRKGRKFSLEAYVIGDNYMSARDALITALETYGPGELVHPYLGRQRVNCFDFSVKETKSEGGMATFTISFVESGEELFPDSKTDPLSATAKAAGIVKASKLQEFLDRFSVVSQPQFVLNSAADKVRGISTALAALQGGPGGGLLGASAAAAAEIRALYSNASALIQSPGDLFGSIEKSFELLFDAVTNKRASYEAAGSLMSFGSSDPAIDGNTATRDNERRNREALNSATQIIALTEASVEAVQVEYTSTRDAEEIRTNLLDVIDRESEKTDISDDLFVALQDLRVELVRGIPGDTENLAVVSSFTPQDTVPSLVAAYDVYGSVSQELDIVSRNKIENPGFIPGGMPIEVLLGEDGNA